MERRLLYQDSLAGVDGAATEILELLRCRLLAEEKCSGLIKGNVDPRRAERIVATRVVPLCPQPQLSVPDRACRKGCSCDSVALRHSTVASEDCRTSLRAEPNHYARHAPRHGWQEYQRTFARLGARLAAEKARAILPLFRTSSWRIHPARLCRPFGRAMENSRGGHTFVWRRRSDVGNILVALLRALLANPKTAGEAEMIKASPSLFREPFAMRSSLQVVDLEVGVERTRSTSLRHLEGATN